MSFDLKFKKLAVFYAGTSKFLFLPPLLVNIYCLCDKGAAFVVLIIFCWVREGHFEDMVIRRLMQGFTSLLCLITVGVPPALPNIFAATALNEGIVSINLFLRAAGIIS